MAMRCCDKCLENAWKFETIEDTNRATCELCGHVVEWQTKKQELGDNSPCLKCGGRIDYFYSKFNTKKLSKPYYYTGYYRCTTCRTFYMSDRFKVVNTPANHLFN